MSDEIVLYQYGGMGPLPSLSPPCLKVFLALRLIGAPHRVENLGSPREVACTSPTKRVPAIEYRGERVAESIRVMDRLEELFIDSSTCTTKWDGMPMDYVLASEILWQRDYGPTSP